MIFCFNLPSVKITCVCHRAWLTIRVLAKRPIRYPQKVSSQPAICPFYSYFIGQNKSWGQHRRGLKSSYLRWTHQARVWVSPRKPSLSPLSPLHMQGPCQVEGITFL